MEPEDVFANIVIASISVVVIITILGEEPSFLIQYLDDVVLFAFGVAVTILILRILFD